MKYNHKDRNTMKNIKHIAILSATFLILISLTSCSFFSSDIIRFGGGTLLDKDMIESIKQEILSGAEDTETVSHQIIDVRTEAIDEYEDTDSDAAQTDNTETHLEESSTFESASDDSVPSENTNNEATVYWTEGGSVWHLSTNCYHLKSAKIYSGYVQDAINAKKSKLCSYCEKHY